MAKQRLSYSELLQARLEGNVKKMWRKAAKKQLGPVIRLTTSKDRASLMEKMGGHVVTSLTSNFGGSTVGTNYVVEVDRHVIETLDQISSL